MESKQRRKDRDNGKRRVEDGREARGRRKRREGKERERNRKESREKEVKIGTGGAKRERGRWRITGGKERGRVIMRKIKARRWNCEEMKEVRGRWEEQNGEGK